MERKQIENDGPQRERAEPAPTATPPRQARHGEGAASALAIMKRLERDRDNAKPAEDRPAS